LHIKAQGIAHYMQNVSVGAGLPRPNRPACRQAGLAGGIKPGGRHKAAPTINAA